MTQLLNFQDQWKDLEQIETPVEEYFAPGVYVRVIKIPSGTWLIGKTHKTEHLNIALKGEGIVFIAGEEHHIKAPYIIKSFPGEKKLFDVTSEMLWATIHHADTKNSEEIEKATVMNDCEEREHILNLSSEVLLCHGEL